MGKTRWFIERSLSWLHQFRKLKTREEKYPSTHEALAWALYGPPVFESRLDYWLELLYLSIIASALAFWLYYRIIRAVGPAKAAYSSVLIPIVAMAISTVAEGYIWSPIAIAGGLLAIAGLIIAVGSRRTMAVPIPD